MTTMKTMRSSRNQRKLRTREEESGATVRWSMRSCRHRRSFNFRHYIKDSIAYRTSINTKHGLIHIFEPAPSPSQSTEQLSRQTHPSSSTPHDTTPATPPSTSENSS